MKKQTLLALTFCFVFGVAGINAKEVKEPSDKEPSRLAAQSSLLSPQAQGPSRPETGSLIGTEESAFRTSDLNLTQGSVQFTESDLSLPGIGGLNLNISRTYRSSDYRSEASLTETLKDKKWGAGMGHGWSMSVVMRAFVGDIGDMDRWLEDDDEDHRKVIIERNGGSETYYYNAEKGQYESRHPKIKNIVKVEKRADKSPVVVYLIEPSGTVYKFEDEFYREQHYMKEGKITSKEESKYPRRIIYGKERTGPLVAGFHISKIYNETDDYKKEGLNVLKFEYEKAEINSRLNQTKGLFVAKFPSLSDWVETTYLNHKDRGEKGEQWSSATGYVEKTRLKSITDTLGRTATFTYDDDRNQTKKEANKKYQVTGIYYTNTNGKKNEIKYSYDENGNLSSVQLNNLKEKRYHYKKYVPGYVERKYYNRHRYHNAKTYIDYFIEPGYEYNTESFHHKMEQVEGRKTVSRYDSVVGGWLLETKELQTGVKVNYQYSDIMVTMYFGVIDEGKGKNKTYQVYLNPQASFPVVTKKEVSADNRKYDYEIAYPYKLDSQRKKRLEKESYKPQWLPDAPKVHAFAKATITGPKGTEPITHEFKEGLLVKKTTGKFETETEWNYETLQPIQRVKRVDGVPQTKILTAIYDQYNNSKDIAHYIYKNGQWVGTTLKTIQYRYEVEKESENILYQLKQQLTPGLITTKELETNQSRSALKIYSPQGKLIEEKVFNSEDPTPRTTAKYSYDSRGRVTKIENPNTNGNPVITRKIYRQSKGSYIITTILNEKITTEIFELYTGKKVMDFDINNHKSYYTYDDVGRLLTATAPDGRKTNKTYAPNFRSITTKTDGRSVTIYLDAFGRKIKTETPPDEYDEEIEYDKAGRPYKTKSGNIKITTSYDSYSRKTSQTHSIWGTSTIDYDDTNHTITNTDPQGRKVITQKNKKGQVIKITDTTSGREKRYEYNGFGERVNTIDPRGLNHPITYDVAGRVTAEYRTSLSGQKTDQYKEIENIYNQTTGQLIERKVIGPNGSPRQFNYIYDNEDRLITLKYNGKATEHYTYDQKNTVNGKGRLSINENPNSKIEYQYDNMGRVTEEQRINKINSQINSHQYSYSIKGELTRQLITNKKTNKTIYETKYTFTPRGEIKQIYYKDQLIATYEYNKNGTIQSVTYGNGIKLENSYEKESLITKQTIRNHPELTEGKSYSYDNAGTPISQTYPNLFHKEEDNVPPRKIINRQYSYTQAEELEEVITNENKNYSYVYDNNSNILQYKNPREEKFKNQFVIAPESDRIIKRSYKGEGHREYYYDNDGNMIEEVYITTEGKELGYMKLSYNYQGQIDTVTKETGKAATYAYNTKRERIHKRIYNGNQPEDIFYIWDAGGRIIAEENATKGETVKYIYGGNEKLAMIRQNPKTKKEEIYYYLNNLQGTPEAIIDSSKTIVQRIQLDEWGRIEKIMGKFQDEITYTGKKLDPETGFYYFNQRYYDPELMRFVSKDPAEQTLNPYLYAGNSPLVYVDPDGEWFFLAPLIGAMVQGAVYSAAVNAAINGVVAIATGGDVFGAIWSGAVNGAISGALSGGVGFGIGAIGSKIAGAAGLTGQWSAAMNGLDTAMTAVQGYNVGQGLYEGLRTGDMGRLAGAAAHGLLMGMDHFGKNPIANFARDAGRSAAGMIDSRFGYKNHVITEEKGYAPGYSDTLDRVQRGDSFPHRNDGSVFKNREGLLPKNPDGYYREYVHPTPGIRGAGPQRIIMGRGGETYFTPDHYKSFRRIDYYNYRESHFN